MKLKYEYDILDNRSRYLQHPWVIFVTAFLLIACAFKLTLFWNLTSYVEHGWVRDKAVMHNSGLFDAYRNEEGLYKVVCYYTIDDKAALRPAAIDPYLCTHIIIGFASVANNTVHPNNVDDYKVYKSVLALKNINPSLKVSISIGEMTPITNGFKSVIAHQDSRSKFVRQCLGWLEREGFDGVDIDWEFPSWPENDPAQRENFTLLLTEFRNQIESSKTNILLSVAVAAAENIMTQSYDIAGMAKSVDFVNLMAYDYHMYTSLLPVTGPNAPLFERPGESGLLGTLNTNWSAAHWNLWGMPKAKIVVGIPTYGHSFTLVNEDNSGWNAPTKGYGSIGGKGFISEPEACTFIALTSTTHVFDDDYKVPYAYNGLEWISYENIQSVLLKAYYIKDNEFSGAMIYSLNTDDFSGNCSGQNFALTRKVSNILTAGDI